METSFTILELAQAVNLSRNGFEKRYKGQMSEWESTRLKGKGSGGAKCYIASSLPSEIQAALVAAGKLEAPQPEAEAVPLCTVVEVELPTPKLMDRSEEADCRALVDLFQARERWCAEQKILRVLDCDLAFAAAYKAGQVEVEENTRQRFPKISRSTITRYRAAEAAGGTAALKRQRGNRKGKNLIELNPDLKRFCEAMIYKQPTINPALLAQAAASRFKQLPHVKTFGRWLESWKKANLEEWTHLVSPDQWRNKFKVAYGSYSQNVERPNQLWQLDSSPADVMLAGGRYSLVACLDVYTRRAKVLVTKTSKAVAIGLLLRDCLLDWGVPEAVKTDNGKDYVSHHVTRMLRDLDVEHVLCQPFSPEQKPFVERFFKTLSRGMTLLPGFLGHNVAERKAIEARKSFAEKMSYRGKAYGAEHLTAPELQEFVDNWLDHYHHRVHMGLKGKTPFQVETGTRYVKKQIKNERALDMLLSEAPSGRGGKRIVQKGGVRFDRLYWVHDDLQAYTGQEVQVLYDPKDMGRAFIYQSGGEFICMAYNAELLGSGDRIQIALAAAKLQKQRVQEWRKEMRLAYTTEKVGAIHQQMTPRLKPNVVAFPQLCEEVTLTAFTAALAAVDAAEAAQAPRPDPSEHELAQGKKALEKQQQERAAAQAEAEAPRELRKADWTRLINLPKEQWKPWEIEAAVEFHGKQSTNLLELVEVRQVLKLPPEIQQLVPEATRKILLEKARPDQVEDLKRAFGLELKAAEPVTAPVTD